MQDTTWLLKQHCWTDASVWHTQAKLLRRMLDSGLEAILVKIAAIGALQERGLCANVANCLNISRQSAGVNGSMDRSSHLFQKEAWPS
jgi:hypothetical protein